MSARPKPTQSEFLDEDLSLLNPSVEAPAIRLADLKNDPSWRPSLGNLDPLGRLGRLEPLAFARHLITFSLRNAGRRYEPEVLQNGHADRIPVEAVEKSTDNSSARIGSSKFRAPCGAATTTAAPFLQSSAVPPASRRSPEYGTKIHYP
jgi:hypothetical protein